MLNPADTSHPLLHAPRSLGGMEPDPALHPTEEMHEDMGGPGTYGAAMGDDGQDAAQPVGLDTSASAPGQSQASPQDDPQQDDEEMEFVKFTLSWIKESKVQHEDDFKRMRQNQEFVAGLQNEGQKGIRDPDGRYICNITLGAVRQAVAQLYARNPTVEVTRQEMMVFEIWDETVETLMDCYQRQQMGRQYGMLDMEAEATIIDFKNGRKFQASVDRVAKTIKIVLDYQMRCAKPDFKEQMKQLVLRVITCGVGYCIPNLIRSDVDVLNSTTVQNSTVDRMKLMAAIIDRVQSGDLKETDPEVTTLKSLALSLGVTQETGEQTQPERIDFDFPPATSIIPDLGCRSLKEFVGAKRLAQEFVMDIDDINAWFGLDGDYKVENTASTMGGLYSEKPVVSNSQIDASYANLVTKPKGRVYRIFDSITKQDYYVVEGHDYFVRKPEPLEPCLSGFWPVFALTFNDIEMEVDDSEMTATIFPPSDVDLMRDAQMEWNASREALKIHRNANYPTYLMREGSCNDEDVEKIRTRMPNEVIRLKGAPADMPLDKIVMALQTLPIKPETYGTQHLEQDLMLGAGMQQANLGPAQPDVTATVGTIAANSQMQVSASKVDNLDGFLSRLMRACGELALIGFSVETVQKIAKQGAVWPSMDRMDYVTMVDIGIKAASSGRPNQALKVQTAQTIVPILLQSGANPIATIEYLVGVMDDTLDPQRFYPIPGQTASGPGSTSPNPSQPGAGPSGPGQVPNGGQTPPPNAQVANQKNPASQRAPNPRATAPTAQPQGSLQSTPFGQNARGPGPGMGGPRPRLLSQG